MCLIIIGTEGTPITRLRLRAGFIDDPEIQISIDHDLDEMETMVEATLAYLSGEQETEIPRPTDLPALLETLIDAEIDQGHRASYDGPMHLTVTVRSFSLKRAFANLIANAIAYGGTARVELRLKHGTPVVTIPRSPEDPKILGVDDSEVVSHLVAIIAPFPGYLDAQEVQDRLTEVLERRIAPVVRDVPVHQPP